MKLLKLATIGLILNIAGSQLALAADWRFCVAPSDREHKVYMIEPFLTNTSMESLEQEFDQLLDRSSLHDSVQCPTGVNEQAVRTMRSGSTLTAALALGFRRDEAARLSFLLGLPAIALAGMKEIWELYKIQLDGHGWSVLLLGLIVASISAFFAIWGLMRILQQFSTWPFVIYRFMLGVVILVGVATGWLM